MFVEEVPFDTHQRKGSLLPTRPFRESLSLYLSLSLVLLLFPPTFCLAVHNLLTPASRGSSIV
jgi:hypothetical protein